MPTNLPPDFGRQPDIPIMTPGNKPAFDLEFLGRFQEKFGGLDSWQESLLYVSVVLLLIAFIVGLYLLIYERERLHYFWTVLTGRHSTRVEMRNILGYVKKTGVTCEVYENRRRKKVFLAEARIIELGEDVVVLTVHAGSEKLDHSSWHKFIGVHFRPVNYKGRAYNFFNSFLLSVKRMPTNEERLYVAFPKAVQFSRRRSHVRLRIAHQGLIRGALWFGSRGLSAGMYLQSSPVATIGLTPDTQRRAAVHDISAGGIRLDLPADVRAGAFARGREVSLKLRITNPASKTTNWLWISASIRSIRERTKGGVSLGLRFEAVGYHPGGDESILQWRTLQPGEGVPGLNRLVAQLKAYQEACESGTVTASAVS